MISFGGWLNPTGIYSVDAAGRVADTGITPKPAIDVSAYQTKRFFATAKDGTKIPYTLIYRKGLKLDGRTLTRDFRIWFYGIAAYIADLAGAFWRWSTAAPSLATPTCAAAGNTAANGTKAGQLDQQAEHLARSDRGVRGTVCEELHLAAQHFAIGGRSAGGIAVGRAMTERPDLLAAVVDGAGWSNPLRYMVEQRRLRRGARMGRHQRARGLSAP